MRREGEIHESLDSVFPRVSPLVQSFLKTEKLFQNIVEKSRQVDYTVQSTIELAEFTVLSLHSARDTVVQGFSSQGSSSHGPESA
ncbi:hypothetical protein Gasu2_44390 [Galdieria sulphuraria]|nr:hypothetical protein Gasu2_44390 [Galdieria sulphuraria]